jgi:hypothetical protein
MVTVGGKLFRNLLDINAVLGRIEDWSLTDSGSNMAPPVNSYITLVNFLTTLSLCYLTDETETLPV